MSNPPPNDPTEPTRPLPPRAVERERVVDRVVEPGFDPRPALMKLEDGVRALRTAALLLGLVAVAALALAFYALLQAEQGERTDRGDGPTRAEVDRLEDRVAELEDREAPDARSVEQALDGKADAQDVEQLQQAVTDLQEQGGQADPQTAQAIEDLTARLDDLEQRVQQQEQQAP